MVFYVVINDTGDEEALISKFPRQTVYRCGLPAGACVNTQDLLDFINEQLVIDQRCKVNEKKNKQNKRNEKVD